MYTILLLDDQSIVRSGLRLLLKEYYGGLQVDEAANGSRAFGKLLNTRYDLLIMDLNLPNTDTFSLLENIRSWAPDMPILIFTMMTEYAFAKRYLRFGVKGYLSKQAEDREILKAVHLLVSGRHYFDQSLTDYLLAERKPGDESDPFSVLSNREFEIVHQLIQGKSISYIADTLNIHTSTVGTHKARILDKLHVDNLFRLKDLAQLYRLI
jgi:two-component system invasion response regulator UvrY